MADKVGGILASITTATLTAKEKAFMGVSGQSTLQDRWITGAGADATIWITTTDNDAIASTNQSPKQFLLRSGSAATNDAVIQTKGLREWNPDVMVDATIIKFKTTLQIVDLTGEFGFGFIQSNLAATADSFDAVASRVVGFHGDNDTIETVTSDGSTAETNNVSAYFTDSTDVDIEAVYTVGTDVKFYIDGTLRATHTTNLPTGTGLQFAFASKRTNGIQTDLIIKYVEAWPE